MEDIKLSVMNGQWRQAVHLIALSNYNIDQVLESITNDEFMGFDDAMRLLRVSIGMGYLQVHTDFED